MSVYSIELSSLNGTPHLLSQVVGKVTLMVNVASKCGLTPQYEQLQQLQNTYSDRGFSVVGFPCNQFLGQEPGTSAEIQEFCSVNYGVTFPLSEKIEVNGPGRHPLYTELVKTADAEGTSGDIRWNFEKFLVNRAGEVVARFGPRMTPDDPEIISAIEHQL